MNTAHRGAAGQATLVIRNIGELVTCDPSRGDSPGVVRDATIAASGATILAVGTARDVSSLNVASDAVEIDAGGAAVIPGFVDAHSHLVWLGERSDEYAQRSAGLSYEEIAAAGGGIRSTVAATAAGSIAELTHAARTRAARMIASGTTTVEIKSGYGIATDAEMRQLDAAVALRADPGMPDVITTYLPLHAAPPENRTGFIDHVCTDGLSQAVSRATFVDAFCETGAYTVDECHRLFMAAQELGLRCKVHAEQRSRSGGAMLAARLGAVSADHLEHSSDDDHRALAAAGVVAVLLPGAAMVLGGPPPPGRRLLTAGTTIALATDCNPGTCYSESMSLMLSLAVATAGITPAEALVAATRGGAAALALTDRGIIRPGMRCDVAILQGNRWLDLAYHLGAPGIATVIREGVIVSPALTGNSQTSPSG